MLGLVLGLLGLLRLLGLNQECVISARYEKKVIQSSDTREARRRGRTRWAVEAFEV